MDGEPVIVQSIVINNDGDVTSAKIKVNGYICNYNKTSTTICIIENKAIVHFRINQQFKYDFLEGMTWKQWLNSEYCPIGEFTISDNLLYYNGSAVQLNSSPVSQNDVIKGNNISA